MRPAVKIDISRPCNQPWENMMSSDSGHYCQSCQKTVIDFSVMSDAEIFKYFNQVNTSVCGCFLNDQLNQVFQPATPEKTVSYWKKIWQLVVAGTLFANQVKSQAKQTELPSVSYPIDNDSASLDALVKSLDENAYLVIDGTNKQPLSGATVIIDSVNNATDVKGVFRINPYNKKITISYIGYKTREISLNTALLPKFIELERNIDLLNEVSVTASSTIRCGYTVGGVSIVRVISRIDKLVRNVNQWIPDPAVKIFPNPVTKGQALNIRFSLPKTGIYTLNIFSSDGKLMHAQSLKIISGKQQVQLPIPSGYSSGIYWLHIQSTFEKQKTYETKVVIR